MAANTIGLNQTFPIYNENGTPFHNLVLRKGVVDSVVMSLGDKITGDVYYSDNTLAVTMKEYIEFNGIKYSLVNPPTIVREGMVADNSELKGMTKYSFEFYHPMCQLANFPFTDVATTVGEEKYLSQNKVFSWIGKPQDFIDKLNKNLQGTVWCVRKSDRFPSDKNNELSDVLTFDNATVAEAIKIGYETWDIPYVVTQIPQTDPLYAQGKRFVVEYGLPSNEIYENDSQRQLDNPFVFRMGKGVGLKNNSRTPRNNKIITRIAGYGSEDNVPYGYPQIVWTGNQDWDYTINNNPNDPNSYPIYKGIVGGQYVKLIKHPFTRTHLMPSIFTETVNKKVNPNAVGYDPTIEIKDYYDAVATQEYPYVNEINLQAPSYESHEFEDIKPEFDSSESMGIVSAIPLNADLTPADHWDDSIDDDGNYLQSYFQITLPQLSFDLYACAAITQEMQINMRSGDCIGCTFNVQVDWDDYKANFYDSDGNFLPDGEQRDLTKYPKSNLGQINVVVQKDNSTFGTLMPNIYQQPKANDLFVFIGISLPLSYITNAEERLDDAMKTYMLENNVYYFDYPLKFDEHFLTTHTNILEQIRPNSIIHFMFGGVEQQLFVKQLTIKYNNTPLPQYDITLTDNIEVVLNQIGQVADDVEKLSSLISVLRQSYSRNVWNELAKKLSKTQDDTAQGYIRFLKGLQVGSNFVPDILGEGGVLRMRDDGKVELVTDILYARVKAYFDTVEIREYKHTAGNRIASVAGNKCVRVAWFNSSNVELEQTPSNLSSVSYFRCFFRASDGDDTVRNNFSIGDQAYCHVTSIATGSDNPEEKGLNQKHFWRLVIGRNTEGTLTEDGEAYIDLSNRATETIGGVSYEGYQSGSDVPQPQDDIIQLGNVNDTTRQGAIVEYVTGTDAPSYQIYQGINSFSLNGKNYVRLGYDSQSGGAQAYIGNPNGSSYLWYHVVNGVPQLSIKAHVEFTNSDSELDTLVQEHQRDDSYDDSWIQPAIDGLQDQIDGELDTWYYEGVPTLNNLPASQWSTDELKNDHVGDLYYAKDTGYAYRFIYDNQSHRYSWTQIHDDAISEALRIANNAQDTAENKRRVFVRQPLSSEAYDVGDLWVNASYSDANVTYSNDVLRCNQAKAENVAFSISHWEKASNYTDDSSLIAFLAGYQGTAQQLKTQIDQKAETWYQPTNPASVQGWVSSEHIGDLWYNTTNQKTYYYDGSTTTDGYFGWKQQNVPIEVFNKIDGKASIFVSQPSNYKANDLWILAAQTTVNGVIYKQGEILTATDDSETYNQGHWVKKVNYTNDDRFEAFVTQILNGTATTGNDQTVAAALYAIKTALNGGVTTVDGGLILTNLIYLRDANNNVKSGISGEYNSNAFGGGIAAWYGGEPIDHEVDTTASNYAKSLFRFDGSGYLASGGISWNSGNNLKINLKSDPTSGVPSFKMLSGNSNESLVLEESSISETGYSKWYGFAASSEVLGVGGDFLSLGARVRTDNTGFARLVLSDVVTQQNVPISPSIMVAEPDSVYFRYRSQGASVSVGSLAKLELFNSGAYAGCINLYANNWLRRAIKDEGSFESGTAYVDTYGYLRVKGLGDTNEGDPGSGGGGTTLNQPLSAINSQELGAASGINNTLYFNGSQWAYGRLSVDNGTIYVGGDSITPVTSSTFGTVFSSYCHDNYVNISNFWNDAGYITSYVDTKNTAGSTNSTGRIYLIGAASQAANPQTYSNEYVYVNNGTLFATKPNYGLSFGGNADISETGQDEIVFYSANTISINADVGVYINGSQPATQSWVNTQLSGYLPLSGGTISGALTVTSSALFKNSISFRDISRATGSDYYAGVLLDNRGLYIGFDEGVNKQLNVDGAGRFNSLYIGSAAVATQSWVNGLGYIAPTLSGLANGDILVYDSVGAWVNVPLSGFGFATQTWVGQQGYITGITSSMITTALGYTPANGSDYLPLSGGTLTGNLTLGGYSSSSSRSIKIYSRASEYVDIHADVDGLQINCAHAESSQFNVSASESYFSGDVLGANFRGIFVRNSSSDSYVLLGGGGHALISGLSVSYAGSAGSVAWTNVSGRPINVSSFTNDSGYITSAALSGYIHPTISGLANGDILVYDSVGAWVNVPISSFLSGYATQSWVQQQGYALTSQIPTNNNQLTNGAGYITSSASITGNAATATKLQTSRTLWGQSFDGTGNVSGDMSGVSRIGFSNAGHFYMDGYGNLIATTNSDSNFWNVFRYDNTSALAVTASSGNVGIGTTTPAYKLHVNGTAGIDGNLTIGGGNHLVLNGSSYNGSSHIYVDGEDGLVLSSVSAKTNQIFLNAAKVYVNVDMEIDNDLFVNSDARVSDKLYVGTGNENINNCSLNVNTNAQIFNNSNNPYLLFHKPGINWARIEVDNSANFHFMNSPTGTSYQALYASGFNQTSDLRKKTITGNVPMNIYNVANAPLFKFTWNDEKEYSGQHIGSAAQYWQTVLPELVSIGSDTEQTLAMQYDVIALASAITVAKKVVDHEERIKILENENKALREEIELLKNKS